MPSHAEVSFPCWPESIANAEIAPSEGVAEPIGESTGCSGLRPEQCGRLSNPIVARYGAREARAAFQVAGERDLIREGKSKRLVAIGVVPGRVLDEPPIHSLATVIGVNHRVRPLERGDRSIVGPEFVAEKHARAPTTSPADSARSIGISEACGFRSNFASENGSSNTVSKRGLNPWRSPVSYRRIVYVSSIDLLSSPLLDGPVRPDPANASTGSPVIR